MATKPPASANSTSCRRPPLTPKPPASTTSNSTTAFPAPYDALYNDINIPLPKPVDLTYIRQLPPPVQRMILRFKLAYDTNRELLQWMWRSYYAGVTMLDDEVGLILMEFENIPTTAVFVLSDHGDQMLEHGLFG